MSFLKRDNFKDRQRNVAAAKDSLLEKFRAASNDPEATERAAARAAVSQARDLRRAEREIAQQERRRVLAEEARVLEADAAKRQAVEQQAEVLRSLEAAEQKEALLIEQKADRDARYAARKAAKKARRKGG